MLDLKDDDFCGKELRGMNFSGDTLKHTKFSKAVLGKPYWQILFQMGTNLLIGFSISVSMAFAAVIAYRMFEKMLPALNQHPSYLSVIIFVSLQLILMRCFILTLERQSLGTLDKGFFIGTFAVLIVAGILGSSYGIGTVTALIVVLLGSTIVLTIGSILLGIAGGLATTLALVGILVAISDNVMQLIKSEGKSLATSEAGFDFLRMMLASSAYCIILLIFSYYMVNKACKYEAVPFLPLRKWLLTWRCRGSTNFTGATLYECDFSNTNLQYIRFNNANFVRCNFQDSENLHLADSRNTSLETFAVRQITLTVRSKDKIIPLTEITEKKDFSHLNLRGVIFANLDLQGCNFYHADISEADFRNCILTNCDLSETMAFGTLFDEAEFSGAIIDNWSIDKTTQFSEAKCKFVYLKRDKSERNPPQGEFNDGDFAKLYQEIANTVDFIAHTPDELQALLRAIEKIKTEGGKIFIQQMERKADSVVLRVQSEGDVELDKAAIYAKVQQQKEIEILAIRQEYEQKLLIQQNELEKERIRREAKAEQVDLLAGLLNKAIDKPIIANTGNIGEINMNDNSGSINNTTIENSAVSLGDNSTVTNTIQQLPDSQSELKDVLMQLVALLEKSQVDNADKQKVEDEIKNLAEIAPKSADERKSSGSKVITTLKDLTTIFKDLPEIGLKYGELLAKLWLLI